ncbi:MAG TPA: 7-carboxy-7-deazaguanine synthase QueE [Gammaproteobacteria bacterium]|nr:7-carboxy-7-deazaguanine synthase QueE [Gammaproteobacteria bacterium]
MSLRITEIFYSIQGETSKIGLPTVFIRLTGCPLRCQYCDTSYAFYGGEVMLFEDIIHQVTKFNCKDVCVTGGEPLAQANSKKLLKDLADLDFQVSLETGGSISLKEIDERVKIIMDIKTPDSGESTKNRWENLELLKQTDELKIVICSREDYQWSKEIIEQYKISEKCPILFSPCAESIDPRDLAEWILTDQLPIRFQMQIHKILWNNQPGR